MATIPKEVYLKKIGLVSIICLNRKEPDIIRLFVRTMLVWTYISKPRQLNNWRGVIYLADENKETVSIEDREKWREIMTAAKILREYRMPDE